MTRSTMRTLLRKRLNEATADQWTDAQLNDILNVSLGRVETEILKVDPLAFLKTDRTPTVASQNYYAKPTAFLYEVELALLDTPTGKYKPMKLGAYTLVRDFSSTAASQYAHFGRYFFINPAPSVGVAAGLQAMYVPVLEMGADTDSPQVHLNLHIAIVDWGKRIALGETGESVAEVRQMVADIIGDLGAFHRVTGDRPVPLSAESKEY